MIVIKMPIGQSEKVLYAAGYSDHPKGIGEHGYVRDIGKGRRWHAYVGMSRLEIHMDQTFGFKHKVVTNHSMEKSETSRIKGAHSRLFLQGDPPKVMLPKSQAKTEYAPNLQELQRAASNLNQLAAT